jgi:integrase
MFSLPNGCSRSNISVVPKNWESRTAPINRPWRIQYRFYDPALRHTDKWGQQITIKGMNHLQILADRQGATRELITWELRRLEDEGFNPITGAVIPPDNVEGELGPDTFFYKALSLAFKRLECADGTKEDIEIALGPIKKALYALKFDKIPVSEVRIRNIVLLLEKVGKSKGGWTPSNFNHFRSYLQMLFKIIVPLANMQGNPVKDVVKMKETKKQKRVLSDKERQRIDKHLKATDYNFWRFLHIFFHSGARTTEMMRVRFSDVDLRKQRFKVLVKKGREYIEVWKPIKTIALPLWKQVLKECKGLPADKDPYLFTKGLTPGRIPINPIQISRRWRIKIKSAKTGLGIPADWYKLKHLNTTETVDYLEQTTAQATEDAAAMNSHTTTAMVVNIYDVKSKDRQFERLKKINNPFSK